MQSVHSDLNVEGVKLNYTFFNTRGKKHFSKGINFKIYFFPL